MVKSKILILSMVYGLWSMVSLTGCKTIIESAKGIAGISTKVLEDNRKTAIVKTINYDYFTCYTKTLEALTQIGAYAYVKDITKGMIAIYVSEADTTPVGLFFKEIDQNHTQIEVSSPSTNAKEVISAKVFSILEKLIHPESKEAPAKQ